MFRTPGKGRRRPHRFRWPAAVAWLLALGAADGLVLGVSAEHRSRAGMLIFAAVFLAALAWGNRHAP
jgi:hypothetical protein